MIISTTYILYYRICIKYDEKKLNIKKKIYNLFVPIIAIIIIIIYE